MDCEQVRTITCGYSSNRGKVTNILNHNAFKIGGTICKIKILPCHYTSLSWGRPNHPFLIMDKCHLIALGYGLSSKINCMFGQSFGSDVEWLNNILIFKKVLSVFVKLCLKWLGVLPQTWNRPKFLKLVLSNFLRDLCNQLKKVI